MGNIQLEDLFHNQRLSGPLSWLRVIFWIPIGMFMAMIHCVTLGIPTYALSCILPKLWDFRRFALNAMCLFLGIIVKVEGRRDKRVKVLVSNYTSSFDHLAVDLTLPVIVPCCWDLPWLLGWLFGYEEMGVKKGRAELIRRVKQHTAESSIPILAFPEGATTNCQKGLLKFSVWPFSLDQPVQPMTIKINRPLFNHIAPSVLGGKWYADLFFFFFVPASVFTIKFLPVMEERDDETAEEFTARVQRAVADELGVEPTAYTSADKAEHWKRLALYSQQQAAAEDDDDELGVMTQQVREVLADVPPHAVRADLALTRDVDLTITNILEGRVAYTPEEPGAEATATTQPPQHMRASAAAGSAATESPSSATPPLTAAQAFGRTTMARTTSFHQRKQLLLDFARRRYLEKHGGTDAAGIAH